MKTTTVLNYEDIEKIIRKQMNIPIDEDILIIVHSPVFGCIDQAKISVERWCQDEKRN